MDQKQDPIRTKAIRKLIFLVAFTAIMLIMSTYAWFSTQKNVTLSGLYGNVNVAEGLQISLDALNWKNEIDLSESGIAQYFEATNETLGKSYDLTNPYEGRTNVTPTELLPVSTTAQSGEGIGLQRLNMYRGENTDGIVLSDIKLLNEDAEAGYYAIDFYLQNSSSTTAVANNIQDLIKLEPTSSVTVNAGKGSTGLQNTLRVGFALFDNAGGTANDVLVSETPSQSQILNATRTQNITDVAIWEPNASGAEESTGEGASKVVTRYASHVDYIVQNNNNIKWSIADAKTYLNQTITEPKVIRYEANTGIPTYALTGASATAVNIANIYDWATPSAGLEKQVTLQTPNTGVGNDPIQLKSVTGSDFAIAPGEYHKLRMYVWLEGQDVDCINYASLGGGLTIQVGLRKGDGGSIDDDDETPTGGLTAEGTYLPTGFREVDDPETDVTIADGAGNQYVWIAVPKTTTVYPTAGLSLDLDSLTDTALTDAYTAIENDLHTYTSVYRNGTSFVDEHSGNDESTGLTSTQYTQLKQKMLKSVYENGGFYVGKYETGIADSYRTSNTTPSETAVIKANAYPYNYVTNKQAQSLASGMASGEYTSSLMFGVQWDLVLKYLETKGVSQADLKTDSTEWGNYYNNTYNITNSNVKYSIDYGDTWESAPYEKTANGNILLTTGASSEFNKAGIYDLAGNVFEWTLEYTSYSSLPCALRGGLYNFYGSNNPASNRRSNSTTFAGDSSGFRVSLY